MAAYSSTLACKIPQTEEPWKAAVHGVAKSWTRLSDFTFTFHFHALEKKMATHSSILAWRIPGTGSLVGCRLWGRTESDTTEATQQQQQQQCDLLFNHLLCPFILSLSIRYIYSSLVQLLKSSAFSSILKIFIPTLKFCVYKQFFTDFILVCLLGWMGNASDYGNISC